MTTAAQHPERVNRARNLAGPDAQKALEAQRLNEQRLKDDT